MKDFLTPDWPAPANIKAFTTTRKTGLSEGSYACFNIATHVNDNGQHVKQNRERLKQELNLLNEPIWLEQVHGTQVLNADQCPPGNSQTCQADASYTCLSNKTCVVMTADCLPVLICNRQGTKVAAVHAGWRGLQAGVIESTIDAMQEDPQDLLLWFGPAIGPEAFEVGDEVRQAFIDELPETAEAFRFHNPGHWLADIYQLARMRLQKKSVDQIYGGGLCTYTDRERFYSYRRDGETGRMASLIWRES